MPQQPISALVLAGGRSRRLGSDKRRLRLWGPDGPTMLEHSVALVGARCAEVLVVLNDPEAWPELPARLVGDVEPGGGALVGILSGLQAAQHDHALVIASDLPLLNPALLDLMIAQPRTYDLLVLRAAQPATTRNRLAAQTLHAIYARRCLTPMRAALAQGQRQITALFPSLRVVYLEPAQYQHLDPFGHALLNLNTPDELALVQTILAQAYGVPH